MNERAKHLDALVAEHVFGWRLARSHRDEMVWMADHPSLRGELCYGCNTLPVSVATWGVDSTDLLPKFSTQIVAAWCVVERMEALHYDVVLYSVASGEWGCTVLQGGIMRADPIAPTAPLAICHAALMTLGVEARDER